MVVAMAQSHLPEGCTHKSFKLANLAWELDESKKRGTTQHSTQVKVNVSIELTDKWCRHSIPALRIKRQQVAEADESAH